MNRPYLDELFVPVGLAEEDRVEEILVDVGAGLTGMPNSTDGVGSGLLAGPVADAAEGGRPNEIVD